MRKIYAQSKPPLGAKINFAHPLSKGIVGCWLMNEGGGDKVMDLSGNANHGTLTGMSFPPTATSGWNPGKFGRCLAFDGNNDYIATSIPLASYFNIASIKEPKTISFWVNPFSIAIASTIIAKQAVGGGGWAIFLQTNGCIQGFFKNTVSAQTTVIGNIVLSVNTWYHVCVAIDAINLLAPNAKIYVKGVRNTETRANSGTYSDGLWNQLTFGARVSSVGGSPASFLNGLVSHIQFFNRELSAKEVLQLYKEPFCMFNR